MKVLVGISGGIDSFFTTKLLISKNYCVSTFTYKFWQWHHYYDVSKRIYKISNYLKIKSYISETEEIFYNNIVLPFIDDYLSGKTPSPCVFCNSEIKFKLLYEYSQDNNIDFIATGHYANVNLNKNRYFISKGIDENKDQSYFLWNLEQKYLKKTILPLGEYKKEYVKNSVTDEEKMLLDKNESNDVCFLGNHKYWEFLESKMPNITKNLNNGNFIFDAKIVGKHKGFYHFTIGQRKNLNVALGFPVYVKKIDAKENIVYLCKEDDMYTSEFKIKDVNYQKYEAIKDGFEGTVKVRYRSEAVNCRLFNDNEYIVIKLEKPQKAICPGQSAVVYENNDIVLGGIII